MPEIEDYSQEVERRLRINLEKALEAMATAAVAGVVRQMQSGYAKPIWRTGDLQRDVQYDVDDTTITVGNSLEYALYIHEGTSKIAPRPYIRDALTAPAMRNKLKRIAERELKRGF